MFVFFPNCLFCDAKLPEERSDEGEHVIPESIYGFWRSHDVCQKCQQILGNEVDTLASRNVSLLNAMGFLKLKDTGPHLDHLSWTGEDTIDKRRVPMIKRGPNFRVKVTKSDDFFECSENDLPKLAKPWLRQVTEGKLSDDEFEAEYKRFTEEYMKLSPGETYHSKSLGYSIRRRQTTNLRVENPTPASFTRLVAKIVVYFIHYAFTSKMVASVKELQGLKDHARLGTPLPNLVVFPQPPPEEGKFFPFHRVDVYPSHPLTFIDITFFGNVTWRVLLHSKEQLTIKNEEGKLAEEMLFILDFSDL